MVSTEEIIERSIYMNILAVALKAGYTLDPDEYLDDRGLPNMESEQRWQADMKKLNKYIYIFGIGNNQERGAKEAPRITLELQGYYPGKVGMERYQIDDSVKDNPRMVETGYTTKDAVIDVHLIAKTQKDMRLLHSIFYKAIPTQGYIKPYFNNKEEFMKGGLNRSENIYLEIGNYYEHPDTDHGILEHVYQLNIVDGVIGDETADIELVPIRDISCIITNGKVTTNISIEGYPKLTKVNDYLYQAEYITIDYKDGKHYIDRRFKPTPSACSAIRSGNFYGRNFDYPYDNRVYFVVNIPHIGNKLASVGVAGGLSSITTGTIGSNIKDLKYIPFLTLDGINEAGVVCNTNIVPTGDKGITTGTNPKIEKRDTISTIMLVRYILDNFYTAREAIEYLDNYISIYSPDTSSMRQEVHIMIADKYNTYILEFINNQLVINDVTNTPWMTNFYITGITKKQDNTIPYPTQPNQYGLTDFSQGLDRWNIIASKYKTANSKEGMSNLLNELHYTNSYTKNWRSEFTGDWTPYGFGVLKIYDNQNKFDGLLEFVKNIYTNRIRDGKTWQTVHSSIYDIENKTLYLRNQEQQTEYTFNVW